jgi:rhodanese-related sulfurtransferase
MLIPTIIRITVVCAIFCSVVVGGVAGCTNRVDDSKVARVSTTDVSRRLAKGSNVLVIDARDASAYATGRLPSARHVRLPDVDPLATDPRFDGYSAVIVYGDNPGSGTAMAMAKRLMQTKHKNVQLMIDGFEQWQREGRPVEQD